MNLKHHILFIALLSLATLISCRKGKESVDKQLSYAGSSESLGEGRYNMQVVQTGDYTCFVGGTYFTLVPFGSNPSSNIDVYNQRTSSWDRFGLSVKRDYYAATALNNKLMIAGGMTPNYIYSAVVDIYDLTTGNITTKLLSKARGSLAAASAGNKILFAGGVFKDSIYKPTSAVDIYNMQTGQWTTDTLSLARTELSAGAAGNKLVFAGGVARSNNQSYYSDRVDIYDVQTGKWTQATLSQPKRGMKVISAGSKIFFYGGGGMSYAENIDVYDVQTNRWTIIPLTGNTLGYMIACTNGSQVAFAYGSNFNYNNLNIYNVGSGSSITVPLPSPIRASTITMAENKIVIPVGVLNDTATRKIFVYDTKTARFDTSSFNLPAKKGNCTAATAGNKILVAGGVWDGLNASNQREVINFKTVSMFELR